MSARSKIRALVDRELTRLQTLPVLGEGDLAALQSLAKTAAIAEGLDVGEQADPEADSEALEKALRG